MTNKYIGEKNPPVFMYRWNWVSVMTQWYFRYRIPSISLHVSSTYLNIFYLLLIKIIIALRLMKKEKYKLEKKKSKLK